MGRAGDGVFTTLAWDGGRQLCAADLHLDRLRRHASVLDTFWPEDFAALLGRELDGLESLELAPSIQDVACRPVALLTVELHSDGRVVVAGRTNEHNLALDGAHAITLAAAPEELSADGVKRLDWSAYREATRTAAEHGANAALLVRDQAIVDADRAMPMLLLADGTLWVSAIENGSVDSITLEMLRDGLPLAGLPLNQGLLKVEMFIAASEAVLIGTGMGITTLDTVDGRVIGAGSTRLVQTLRELLSTSMNDRWMTFDEVVNHL